MNGVIEKVMGNSSKWFIRYLESASRSKQALVLISFYFKMGKLGCLAKSNKVANP